MLRNVAPVLAVILIAGALAPSAHAEVNTEISDRVVTIIDENRTETRRRPQQPARPTPPRDLDPGHHELRTPADTEKRDNRAPADLAHTLIPECWDAGTELAECQPRTPSTDTPPSRPSRDQVESVVRHLVARLRLPDANPRIGPDPARNEWNKAVVGLPYWLWIDGPTNAATTVTGYGITITMDARRANITFNPGDGTTLTCTTTTAHQPRITPGAPSPTCGHTYQQPSPAGRDHTLSATAHWLIDWTAIGYTGTISLDITDSRTLPVTELQAINVKP
ncbi:MAG: hypothetical protein Q4F65_08180 [Propionibacteriaceae bacterium]|nr:hypothetical protein [Propionibacteriaceae bacterium]